MILEKTKMSKPASKKDGQKRAGARSAPGRQEIIAEIQKLKKKLGRIPTLRELVKRTSVSRFAIAAKFGMYKNALVECGLYKPGNKLSVDELFRDWAAVARKLGKVPSIAEYGRHAKYSHGPLIGHFGGWRHVPAGLLQHGRAQQMEQEWPDVMQLLAWYVQPGPGGAGARKQLPPGPAMPKPRIAPDEPIYGAPFFVTPLAMAPTCENGVIFLFATVARDLGFMMIRLQTGFPDGEGFREVEPGRWQLKKIEFELESRNYVTHGHPLGGAHILVCWKHNWEECPLEVIELRKLVGGQHLPRRHGGTEEIGDRKQNHLPQRTQRRTRREIAEIDKTKAHHR
jgi:hypothetical protein